jgi:predicted ferric reductase
VDSAAAESPLKVRKHGSGSLLIVLYLLCSVFALILLTFVHPHTDDGLIHQIGKNCALVAFIILTLQVVLAARIKWIERPFGLDMIFRFHKAAAILAFSLLILHFTLVAWGSRHWRLLTAVEIDWPIWLGRLALLALGVNIAASLWRSRLHINFESWRSVHNSLAVIVLALGFVHSYRIGGDLSPSVMRVYWITALSAGAVVYFFHKGVRPARLRRNQWTVAAVRREGPKVWTVYLDPPAGKSVHGYAPGQFHYITFRRGRGLPVEEHHWTISSSPTRPGLASTIKEVGDFTATIGLTKPGDKADVDGPYGRFSYLMYPDEGDLLFICGGIGITPFLAMLRHMHDRKVRKKVLLLWSNKTEQDIVAREELDTIAASGRPQLTIVHFLTRAGEEWQGERGRIGRGAVAAYLRSEEAAKRGIYVCCPHRMFKSILPALRSLGISADRIHYEGFAL